MRKEEGKKKGGRKKRNGVGCHGAAIQEE